MEGFLLVMLFLIPFAFLLVLGAAFFVGIVKEAFAIKEASQK
jgi:hypothetical protein